MSWYKTIQVTLLIIGGRGKWSNNGTKRLSSICCQDWWIRSLTVQNWKFLKNLITLLANLEVVSLIWEKQTYHCRSLSFLVKMRKNMFQNKKGICFKTGDNFGKFCKAKPATFFSLEDLNCMDESQSSTKQRNGVFSCLDSYNKSRLSWRWFCWQWSLARD